MEKFKTTESLFDNNDEIRLCKSPFNYGLQFNYFIANHTTKKVLKKINQEKFDEILNNYIFEYNGIEKNVESWTIKK